MSTLENESLLETIEEDIKSELEALNIEISEKELSNLCYAELTTRSN